MKKYDVLILITIVTLFGITLAFGAEIPYPFDEIKTMAMEYESDSEGDYLIKIKGKDDIVYVIGWFPKDKFVVIGIYGMGGILYDGSNNTFQVIISGFGQEISRETALKLANDLYRKLKKSIGTKA